LETNRKKILIFDETGFARICNALLESMEQRADIHPFSDEHDSSLIPEDYDLLITSYPYGGHFLNSIRKRDMALIILSTSINSELLSVLNGFKNCFCMIKPLDFDKFRSIVSQAISGKPYQNGGFQIV